MPSLKDYRDRIASVKSTRKITSAMKMVAASKLKKAQEAAESSQPYAVAMAAMMARVAEGVVVGPNSPKLLIGTGKDDVHLLVVVTSDRGLCGGFNGNLVRLARKEIRRRLAEGKEVKVLCLGRKGRDVLKRDHSSLIIKSFTQIGAHGRISFAEVDEVAHYILHQFEDGAFDVCTLLCNEFKNVLVQKPVAQQLIPFEIAQSEEEDAAAENASKQVGVDVNAKDKDAVLCPYAFEPEEEVLLGQLLPKNLGVQLYRALLDSAAGEQAARMTAMDNATRNAGDRINGLTLQYNRARQAFITKELIEIISGAEAV